MPEVKASTLGSADTKRFLIEVAGVGATPEDELRRGLAQRGYKFRAVGHLWGCRENIWTLEIPYSDPDAGNEIMAESKWLLAQGVKYIR